MADLITIKTFFENADANADFKARIAAALVEWAIDERDEVDPEPLTLDFIVRQEYARSVLNAGPAGVMNYAESMLPALAVIANDAGLLAEDGTITATDAQITATITDAFVDRFAANVPSL